MNNLNIQDILQCKKCKHCALIGQHQNTMAAFQKKNIIFVHDHYYEVGTETLINGFSRIMMSSFANLKFYNLPVTTSITHKYFFKSVQQINNDTIDSAITCSQTFLDKEIKAAKPKLIFNFGGSYIEYIFGKSNYIKDGVLIEYDDVFYVKLPHLDDVFSSKNRDKYNFKYFNLRNLIIPNICLVDKILIEKLNNNIINKENKENDDEEYL